MIRNSFIFLEKVGVRLETNIWRQGIKDWPDFLAANGIRGLSPLRKRYCDRRIREALQALSSEDYSYFIGKLPAKEMWRLYGQVKDSCCFLDIEIDALGRVILVGISNYYHTNFFIKGVNLDPKLIQPELAKYNAIITFNGSSFDLPRLKKLGLEFKHIHIDLKPLCVNLSLTGGLKEVEKRLNLRRPAHLYGNPIDLWQAFHASGDREYLDLLIEYNREDVENLKGVMGFVYNQMREKLYKEINPT